MKTNPNGITLSAFIVVMNSYEGALLSPPPKALNHYPFFGITSLVTIFSSPSTHTNIFATNWTVIMIIHAFVIAESCFSLTLCFSLLTVRHQSFGG
jgi:hypothetical protein